MLMISLYIGNFVLDICVRVDFFRVLYFSIHRFEHGTFWPNLEESNADYIGEGAGEGYNFNIPLNKTGLGNADYLTIFHQLLLPVAIEV